MTSRTGFGFHELYLWHNTGNFGGPMPYGLPMQPGEHSENPETKRRFRNLLDATGFSKHLHQIEPRYASETELMLVHTQPYIERIKSYNDAYAADAGFLTPVGRGSYDIARLAAGGMFAAADAIMAGEIDNAYVLNRPPGHHATADEAMGFCLFNNIALTARYLQQQHGLNKIAIVDWDVHHGNGAQSIFWEDNSVLTMSLHQNICFPVDSGFVTERGAGKGEGYNINVPLPPGCGIGAYEDAFERVILPALHAFKPDFILIASGLDAGAMDPMARMLINSAGFRTLTKLVKQAATTLCGGRLLMSHEGGYHAPTVPFFGLAIMEELSGLSAGVTDPFLDMMIVQGGHDLEPHQQVAVDAAVTSLEQLKSALAAAG